MNMMSMVRFALQRISGITLCCRKRDITLMVNKNPPAKTTSKKDALVYKRKELQGVNQIEIRNVVVRGDYENPDTLPSLIGSPTFKPSRIDQQLVDDMCRLLRQGNVAAWEADDVVRNNGGVLMPFHVCQVLSRYRDDPNLAFSFFKWANMQPGYDHDTYSCNAILKVLGDHKRFDEINEVLVGMDDQAIPKTNVTYKTLMFVYLQSSMVEEALEAFSEFEACSVWPEVRDYNFFMDKMVKLGSAHVVPLIFKSLRRKNFKPDTCTFNIVINSLCKMGKVDEAYKLFESMRGAYPPDEYTYATMISGFCKCMKLEKAREMLTQMIEKGFKPSEAAYNVMMDAHARCENYDDVPMLFEEMRKEGCKPNSKSFALLIGAMTDAGSVAEAYEFIKAIAAEGHEPDVVACNTLISRLSRCERDDLAMELFEDMKSGRFCCRANVVTYNTVIDILGRQGRVEEAWQMYLRMGAFCKPDTFTYSALMLRLGRAGMLERCMKLLDEMNATDVRPNRIVYTGIIEGLAKAGRIEDAVKFAEEMKEAGFVPRQATLNLVISCLLKSGKVDLAEKLVEESEQARREQ